MQDFFGTVVRNIGRGKQLGFPTANVDAQSSNTDGLYIAEITIDSVTYPSLLFIGKAVTFGEEKRAHEVYILDFNKDIYNQQVSVHVIKKIRENKKFANAEELITQMKMDERFARTFFGIK
ncbi:MAG: riboflavin kinase [Candidatus Roizmanbacteria bacterium]